MQAAPVISNIRQAGWASMIPTIIVAPISGADAGIKIMILNLCAKTAPSSVPTIASESILPPVVLALLRKTQTLTASPKPSSTRPVNFS
jgi:hypothetical protein